MRVFGIRKALREYLTLLAVGSMLGSTQVVDMETTRISEFGRVLIAVLDPLLVPAHLDVVIGDHYVELEFEVEKLGIDENGDEMNVDWIGEEGGGEGKGGKGFDPGSDPEEERDSKRKKNNEEEDNGKEQHNTNQNMDGPANNLAEGLGWTSMKENWQWVQL